MTKPTYAQRVATTLNIAKHRRARSPHATSVLTFSGGNPTTGQTVQIADRVYTITRGANLAATIASIAAAITADPMSRVDVTAHDGTTIEVEARRGGWGGAGIVTATNATGAAWSASSLIYEHE